MLHIAWAEGLLVLPITPMRQPITPYRPKAGRNRSKSMFQRELSTCGVDLKGVFHILYIDQTEEAGVYYIRSEDTGRHLVGAGLVRPGYSARPYSR